MPLLQSEHFSSSTTFTKNGKCSNGHARPIREGDRQRDRDSSERARQIDRDSSEREPDREKETEQQRQRDRGSGSGLGMDGGLRKGVANDVAVVVL